MDQPNTNRSDQKTVTASPTIFSRFRVGPYQLKNRLVSLPVYTGYAHPDGRVSSLLIEHYSRLAASGVALVIVANAVVAPDGIASRYNLRIDRDELVPGLARLAGAIKRCGALACLQLNHAGRFAKTAQPLLPTPLDNTNLSFNLASLKNFMNFFPLEKRFGLTRYFLKLFGTWRRAMNAEDRERIIDSFGKSAIRAYEAGFDMIELHGANGYLLCQFLSPFTNKVQTEFGGDFQGRTAFPLAVIREIRKWVPNDFPVGIRILLREWVPDGIDLPEALAWAKLLENEGIAYFSAAAGTYNSIFSSPALKQMARPGYFRKDVAALTRSVRIPTIVSGRITTPSLANKLLKEGVADLIGLGRPLRTDIDWVIKALNPGEKVKTCVNCNWCLKRVILEQGLSCRRWPKVVQERIDLEHKALTRMYKGLLVASDMNDLELFKTTLPHLLPNSRLIPTPISPTILFLKSDKEDCFSNVVQHNFLDYGRKILESVGFNNASFSSVVRDVVEAYDKEVHDEVERGDHGMILIGRNRRQAWRERVLYKERAKVVALIGSNNRHTEILVPVDLSATTLLVLRFVCQTFVGKRGVNLNFVHILDGPADPAEQRWKELKEVVGWDEDFLLNRLPLKANVTADLLEIVNSEAYGMIVMGKRGLSGIKRWLLGSVSAGVLRGLTDQSLVLID
ncbi:universal stress protein [Thermodesulfobacteriota bacterium]